MNFPPHPLLVHAKGRHKVVKVHEDMHETVEGGGEEGAAARGPTSTGEPQWEHCGVVVEVQKRHLVVLLTQDKEDL